MYIERLLSGKSGLNPGILRDFFSTCKNQKILIEFYKDSVYFLKDFFIIFL